MTPLTLKGSEIEYLWRSFAGRGGGISYAFIMAIFSVLQSVDGGKGRISRQNLKERLINEYKFKEKLQNFDRTIRKLENEQLIRKEKEIASDVSSPNKERTYYRLNYGLIRRGKVIGRHQVPILPVYRIDPPDPVEGEEWVRDPNGPLPPPVELRDVFRLPVYSEDPQKPKSGEMWLLSGK